jgi:UDP-glucuronate 4-epimerase
MEGQIHGRSARTNCWRSGALLRGNGQGTSDMKALITGVAGFIGSALARELVGSTDVELVGVDSFTPYYSREQKESNVFPLLSAQNFEFYDGDLREVELERVLDGVDVVYHLAAQPGVRASWGGNDFRDYVTQNVLATHRLLQAALDAGVPRVVYASSSSVYGNTPVYPTHEEVVPKPFSPYGVTKLAGEHLCTLYAENFGMNVTSLRFFTVYGPGQRPDMAIHRMIECALDGEAFGVYGNGGHVRSFTYVADVVDAVIRAGESGEPGDVVNVAGGSSVDMRGLVDLVSDATGRQLKVRYGAEVAGDVKKTDGSVDRAWKSLGWRPRTELINGLAEQVKWHLWRRGRL